MKTVSLVTASCLLFCGSVANATVNYNGGWYLQVEPFYAKITDNLLTNSIFAVKVADPAIQGDFKEEYHKEAESQWAGYLELGYDFPSCTCNTYGIAIGYEFINLDHTSRIANDARNEAGLPVLAPAEFIDITDEATAKFSKAQSTFEQNLHTIDLLAKKHYYLANCSQLTMFGGIEYFQFKEDLKNQYDFHGDIEEVTVTNLYTIHFENRLNTIGPHLGAALVYPFGCGFGLTGQLAGSLLYGESKSSFHNFHHLSPDSVLGETTELSSFNHNDYTAHFVPVLSGKVGVNYQLKLRCVSLLLEAGYKGDRYYQAANDVAYQQLLAGDDINSTCNYQDVTVAGPYFSVTLHS